MQNGLVVNNVKPFNNLETTSTKRENKSIKEKGHGNRSCESLSTAAKHFKVKNIINQRSHTYRTDSIGIDQLKKLEIPRPMMAMLNC